MAKFLPRLFVAGGRSRALRSLSTTVCNGSNNCFLRCITLHVQPGFSDSGFATAKKPLQTKTLLAGSRLSGRRLLSSSSKTDTLTESSENLIAAWFNEVQAFGAVCVQDVPFDVRIQPLNPVDYPDHNKSIVNVYYSNSDSTEPIQAIDGRKLSELGKLCDLKVKVEEEGGRVDVRCNVPSGVRLPLLCVITVPMKFDVEIKANGGSSVTIGNLESDSINIHMTDGDCHLTNLKTANTKIQCDNGSIISRKQLLGCIDMQCSKQGTISADRFQGTSIDCRTEAGAIDIKTLYAERTTCSSLSGDLHIRDCHGDVTATTAHGNLSVDSLDGKLSAELETGSADVFLTRQEGVSIHSNQGDITLRFTEDGSCSLDLEAEAIKSEDQLLHVTLDCHGKGFLKAETESTVKASAPQGKIHLKLQDWLSSLNLHFGSSSS